MFEIGNTPRLEISNTSDRRFNAFFAKLDRKSIKTRVDEIKRFNPATGTSPYETLANANEVHRLFQKLWREYLIEQPELSAILRNANGISDENAGRDHESTVLTLWAIRNELRQLERQQLKLF